jgi:hypothetical protein
VTGGDPARTDSIRSLTQLIERLGSAGLGLAEILDSLAVVRQLAGETGEPLLMRTVHRRTGEVKWDLPKSTLLCDQAGEPLRYVTGTEPRPPEVP